MHCEFARAILAPERHAAMSHDGTNINQHRLDAVFQQRQSQTGHFRQGEKIDLKNPSHSLRIGILESSQCPNAGIVDQDVQSAILRLRCLNGLLPDLWIGNISDYYFNPPVYGGNFVG